jgi:hypothetical protein|tara:strand:- start:155 stop:394 length:240 start_codon:yes stop_codon:yes gene_type:complete
MDKVIKAGWDDTKPVEVLNENGLAVMMKTIVDEMEFPQFIVKTIGPFSTERVFKYDQYDLAEKYYNDLYFDRSHSISKW